MSAYDKEIAAATFGRSVSPSGWVRGNCPLCERRVGKPDRKNALGLSVRTGYFSCFAAETKILTWDGYVEIGSVSGTTQRILTVGGKQGASRWVEAPISSFGVQRLWRLVLRRNGVLKVIHTTAKHRWFVKDHAWRGKKAVVTSGLKKGQALHYVIPPRSLNRSASPWGAAHGFTYGDGMRLAKRQGARVCLWGKKDEALLPFFPWYKARTVFTRRDTGGPVVGTGVRGKQIDGLPYFFKERPSLEESFAYLYGWLAGYFAADGCVSADGNCTLASADRTNLEFVRKLCIRLGIKTYDIKTQMRRGCAKKKRALYSLSFYRRSLTENFFIGERHRTRWLATKDASKLRPGWVVVSARPSKRREEVFCATVEGTGNFVLEGDILTGNCFRCHASGRLKGDWYESTPRENATEDNDLPEPPAHFYPLFDGVGATASALDAAREYVLHKRKGLSEGVLRTVGVGGCTRGEFAGRVVVPVLSPEGAWLWYVGRAWGVSDLPYRYPSGGRRGVLYNAQALRVKTEEPVLVVEGAFDAIAHWPNAVAVLGKPTEDHLEALSCAARPVVFVLDGDSNDEAEAWSMRLQLDGVRSGFVPLVPKVDPDEIPSEELCAAARKSVGA